jgi:hypothetical protein
MAADVVSFSGRWPERNLTMVTIRVNMAADAVSCSGCWPERNPTFSQFCPFSLRFWLLATFPFPVVGQSGIRPFHSLCWLLAPFPFLVVGQSGIVLWAKELLIAGAVSFFGRWPERNLVMATIRVSMVAGDVSFVPPADQGLFCEELISMGVQNQPL